MIFGGFTLLVRLFGVRAYTYKTDDMAPTIMQGDKVIVRSEAYKQKNPLVDDIITLVLSDGSGKMYVRRIAGVSGETMTVQNQNISVPQEHYFVLADNKEGTDSRNWGSIPKENIRGEVILIYAGWKCKYNKFRKK